MNRSSFRPTVMASLVGLGGLALTPVAAAQAGCEADTCPAGFECLTGPTACVGICEVPSDGEEPVCYELECDPEEYTYCVRATCVTDSDCGDDMVCHTTEQTLCPSTDPPILCAGDDCENTDYGGTAEEDEADCEQTQQSQCAYPHELPCDTDAQCGEGYACVASETCWCSGGSPQSPDIPAGADAPGTAPPPPVGTVPSTPPPPPDEGDVPECGCEPTGSNHCQVQEIECESDADCPAEWSCVEAGAPCWMDSDGNSGCEESTLRCYPTERYDDGGPGSAPGNPTPIGESDSPDQAPLPDGPTAPGEPPPVGEPSDNGAGDSDGHGSNGHGASGGHSGSGNYLGLWAACSVDSARGAGTSGSPWALSVLALGAAALLRRRRG